MAPFIVERVKVVVMTYMGFSRKGGRIGDLICR